MMGRLILAGVRPAMPPVAPALRRLARDTRGGAAIEFGMVAVPFLLLLGAIIEAGMLILAQQLLDDALDRGGRAVFTGVYQDAAGTKPPVDRLVAEMCRGPVLFDCTKLKVEMTTASTFSANAAASPYDSTTGTASSTFGTRFTCPQGSDIVTIRAAVVIPRFFGFTGIVALPVSATAQMITATTVFRAEPYPVGTC